MAASIAGRSALAACSQSNILLPQSVVAAEMANAIAAAEAAWPHSEHTATTTLAPQQMKIDLDGVTARTLAAGNTVLGRAIRANIGDELTVIVTTRRDYPTSVH